jgi:hypothetical protein
LVAPNDSKDLIMKVTCERLLPHERAALIAALRRDVRDERDKAIGNPESADYHLQNARMSVRLLEAYGYREERLEALVPTTA